MLFKKKMGNFLAVIAAFSFFGSAAFAEFSMDELVEVTKIALKDFSTTKAEHVPGFTGYKVWKSGEASKVKIYVSHDGMNMEFNYLCEKHDATKECHAQ